MRKTITDQMVIEFNKKMLIEYESPVRLIKETGITDYAVKITIEDKFIEYISLGLSDEFYSVLESFFKKYDITLNYNNTGTIFWSILE